MSNQIVMEHTSDGVYVKHSTLQAGPFNTVNDIDIFAVAEQLNLQPKQILAMKLRALGQLSETQEGQTIREAAVDIGDTFNYTGDQPFAGKAQIIALGAPESRSMRLTFKCEGEEDCDASCNLFQRVCLEFESANICPSAWGRYFDSNNPMDALKELMEHSVVHACPKWRNFTSYERECERAVTQVVVTDLQGTEGKGWFVHGARCDLKRCPNWVNAEGWLCKGHRGRIGILVSAFTPESEVAAPKPNEVENARKKLSSFTDVKNERLDQSTVWKVAQALQRRNQLKGKEIVRGHVADLLTAASPVWVQTPEGPRQLGSTTCELGPTTTAKSMRIRMFRDWLDCGKYDTGRKTVAGLTAGNEKIQNVGWIVRKGLLPSMDRSWLAVDNMPPHALDSQIESRRDGIVRITAIHSSELWARTRLKLLSNPLQPFDEILYRCTALKMFDPKLIARLTFAVFTYGASTDERYGTETTEPLAQDAEMLSAAKTMLRWNISREMTFTVSAKLWPVIIDLGRKLDEKYGCEDLPLLLRANPYKLSVLAYSFALLEGADEPSEHHVKLAYEWLHYCAKDIELDKYVEWWKSQHVLTDDDYDSAKAKIEAEIAMEVKEHGGTRLETYTYKIVEYLIKNEKGQRDELAAYTDIEPQTVSVKVRLLKALGLLRSDKNGYCFTAKGVRFFKRWLQEQALITDVTNLTTSNGQTRTCDGKQSSLRYLETLKTGNMSKISNAKPLEGWTRKGSSHIVTQETVSPDTRESAMFQLKSWCYANRDERSEVSLVDVENFIQKELKQDPKRLIDEAYSETILMPSSTPGKAVVV